MKYRLLTLLAITLLLFSPALAEAPETEEDASQNRECRMPEDLRQ